MTKLPFVFAPVILALVVVACGITTTPDKPTPTDISTDNIITPTARTVSQTPIPRPSATLAPTATMSIPIWGNPPPRVAGAYGLKRWDSDTAWDLANATAPTFPQNDDGQAYDVDTDWTQVRLTLLREIVARGPTSNRYSDAIAALAAPESYGWPSTAPIEPFRIAVEAALNQSPTIEISTTTLSALIAKALQQDNITVVQVLPADNILGDGAAGWVLEVRASYSYGAAFGLAGKPGAYHLVSPRTEWQTFTWSDQRVSTYDLNANGIPELAIWDSHWGTGMSHFCEEYYSLFEWDGHQFVNLAPGIETSANTDSGGCLDFGIVEGPNGTSAITTGNLIDTGCWYGDHWGVGALLLKRRYEWNGVYFSLVNDAILPLENTMPEDEPINKCTLSWVNEAGAANNEAYQLLPTLLAATDPVLTTGFAEQFGPAYLDYFRFKLGTWYAMRGQQAQALAVLAQVRDNPANPEFETASQLAEAFLQAYPVAGAYAGCALAGKLLDISDFRNATYVDEFAFNTSEMREAWGFSDWQWGLGGGSLWSGPTVREDPMNVCSLAIAFRLSVQRESFQNAGVLTNWLTQQQIPYTGLEEGDVDGDGQRDWVVLVGTGQGQSLHAWALLARDNSTLPLWISDIHRTTGNIPATWNTFVPGSLNDTLNIYQWTDGMVVFRVVSQKDWAGIDLIHESVGYYRGETLLGFTIQPLETGTQQDADSTGIRVLTAGKNSWEPDWYILGWDTALNTLEIMDSPQHNQDQQVLLAENLIYYRADPIAATEVISRLLSAEYQLLDEGMTRYSALPQMRPYLLYLQGLAYEMSEDEQRAVEAYWTLWHDFPIHPLSYLAQQKLEARRP